MGKLNWRKGTAAQLRQRDAYLFGLWPALNERRKRNAKRSVMPQTKAEARAACQQAYDEWCEARKRKLVLRSL